MKNDDPILEFMETLSHETLVLVFTHIARYTKDKNAIRLISSKIVSYLVSQLLTSSLNDYDTKMSKELQLKYVRNQFSSLKKELQIQVADGFNRAMLEYSGQDLDYYCKVNLALENKNTRRMQ